jgi:hypothetical protein
MGSRRGAGWLQCARRDGRRSGRARNIARAPSPSLALPATTARAAETGSGAWLASSVSEPGSGVSEPPQARSIEARGQRARYGQRIAGLVIGLALLSALLAWRSRSSSAALRPDPALARVTLSAIRPALGAVSVASPKATTAIPEPEVPATPVPPSSALPGAPAHGSVPSPNRVSDPWQPSSAAKPPKSVFHPHNIAPYRPRGI